MPPDAPSSAAKPDASPIALEVPPGVDFVPVVRLVLGGVAARAEMGFQELDDLQLGVERLLAEAVPSERVRIVFDVHDGGVRTRIGPLETDAIATALQGPDPAPGELGLRRVLDTVVDSFGVEVGEDGRVSVRLEKRVPAV